MTNKASKKENLETLSALTKKAADASANLRIFSMVSGIFEGSEILKSRHASAAEEIISICNDEISKAIDDYDAVMATIAGREPGE